MEGEKQMEGSVEGEAGGVGGQEEGPAPSGKLS